MEVGDDAPQRHRAAVLAAVLAISIAGVLRADVRAVAAEALPLSRTNAGSDDSESLLLAEPLLASSIVANSAPIFFVAQQDGGMQGTSAGNQAGASSNSILDNGVVSGNPGASNVTVGTGWLGDYLGINRNGWRFAGLTIADANGLSGGLVPGWTGDSLTVVDISIDTAEAFGWENGLIGSELLYYSGGPVNANAGTVMGYNSLDIGIHHRAEIYTLWYLHRFLNNRLLVRIGKSITTYDFNNVVVGSSFADEAYNIAAVSALIFTPLYISPTQLGVVPGYFDSATGVVTTLIPIEGTYVKYGLYDGNLAAGRQIGSEGPHFNGYALNIVEIGASWRIGQDKLPGKCGAGYWYQSGVLQAASGPVVGAQGMYLFGSQRLYYERPGKTNEGLSMFLQFAGSNTPLVDTHRYFGCGLTYIGLLPGRENDSVGWGLAYGKMNDDPVLDLGADEVILSWYYQWMVGPNCFLQPNISYIPNPAAAPDISSALPVTLRAILLF